MSKIESNSEFDAEEVGEVFAEVNRRTIEAQAARIKELEKELSATDAREQSWKEDHADALVRISALEAQVKAFREAAIAISYSQGFGECEGLADFESVQLMTTQGAIRAITSALEMSEKSNVER